MAEFGICGYNKYIVDDPTINITYDEILAMKEQEFLDYITRMRSAVRDAWNNHDVAPAQGWSEEDVRAE